MIFPVLKGIDFTTGNLVIFPESMAKGSSAGFMGVIIMRVIAKSYHHQSHCRESLHRVIAQSHLHRVIAQSHCTESLLMRVSNSFLLFLGRRGRADSTLRKSTLCGDRRGRGQKNCGLFSISDLCARPSAEIGVVEVTKTEDVLRFLICARDLLRRSAWSRLKN